MRFHRITLGAGALLLIAAQDAPPTATTEPSKAAAPSEPEAPPSDAAAVPSEPAEEPAATPSETPSDRATAPSEAPSEPALPPAETPREVAAPRKGEPPTREFMAGVWTEDLKKCASALEFKADGTLIGPFPRWELTDGLLTMAGNRQKIWLTVIDKNTMQSRRSETDPPRTLKRCPATTPPPPQP